VLKDIRQGYRRSVMHNAVSFSILVSGFRGPSTQQVVGVGSGNKLSRSCTQSDLQDV